MCIINSIDSIDGMELLRLLQWVLAGVGVFIVRVGFLMVKSINSNTDAVAGLAKSIERLIQQHENQADIARQQVADSTTIVMSAAISSGVGSGSGNIHDISGVMLTG